MCLWLGGGGGLVGGTGGAMAGVVFKFYENI